MRNFNKKLAATAVVAALTAVVGGAWAQADLDPQDTPQANTDMTNGAHIYQFKNEGVSPETDPAAHLILLKHSMAAPPVAVVQTTTTVAQADTAPMAMTPAPAPAATDSSTAPTDSTPAPADTMATPAPKADRN